MANYQSREDRYNRVQDPINLNLINSVLAAKEGKYDQNLAQIDQSLAELGSIDSRLLRAEDREHLSNNIKGLVEQLNGSGKMDLSKSGITRNIKSQINSALDSKVINAVAQSTKISKFQAEVEEKRKSDKGLFDEGNYQDALERGGVNEYLKGVNAKGEKVDTVGNLSYTDYVDVAGQQNKLAMEFAKNVGVEQYLGDKSNSYQTVEVYGKRVSKVDLENYINSNLDNKAMAQLQINTRQTIGKMDDAGFNKMMTEHTNSENEELKLSIAAGEAELKGKTGDEAKAYAVKLEEVKSKLVDNNAKLGKGTFDRSEMYRYYTNTFVKGIADNYDIDVVTKIDRDNLPFEIMKFETETMLKTEELKIKREKEAKDALAAGGGGGTETTRITNPEDQVKSDVDNLAGKTYHTSRALDAYLKQNDEGYAEKNPQEQWAYMLNLKANSKVKGQGSQYMNLVEDFKDAQRSYANVIADSEKDVKNTVASSYNDMVGGSINLGNLQDEMPLTARLVKTGKKYESLSVSEQSALTAEMASNYIKNGPSERGEMSKLFEKIIIKNKSYLQKNNKALALEINKSATSEKPEGKWASTWNGLKLPYYAGKTMWNATKSVVKYGSDLATEGKYYADQEVNKTKDTSEIEKSWGDLGSWLVRGTVGEVKKVDNIFTNQDSNITELQSGDLRKSGGKAPMAIGDRFHNLSGILTKKMQIKAASYLPNLDKNKAFTFSTEDKTQEGVAVKLRATILNATNGDESVAIPSKDNDITVSREGERYRLDYLTGTGEKQTKTSVLVDELPPGVREGFDDRQQVWRNDPMNPNIRLESVGMSLYTDPSRRNSELKNYTENVKDFLPIEVRSKLNTDPSDTSYATRTEKIAAIKKGYSKEFYEKNKTSINNIISANYQATPFIDNGEFYFKIAFKNEDEEMEEVSFPSLGDVKQESIFEFQYREAMGQLIDQRIKELQN